MTDAAPRSRLYRRATVIFNARQSDDGRWLPCCTVVCGMQGRRTDHVFTDDVPRESQEAADAVAFELAKAWIDQHDGEMTSFSWGTPVDDESRRMWRDLFEQLQ